MGSAEPLPCRGQGVREDQSDSARARARGRTAITSCGRVSVDRAARHADVSPRAAAVLASTATIPACPTDARTWCGARRGGVAARGPARRAARRRRPNRQADSAPGGLGGGSSDAAAAIRGLAALWRVELPRASRRRLSPRSSAPTCRSFSRAARRSASDRGDGCFRSSISRRLGRARDPAVRRQHDRRRTPGSTLTRQRPGRGSGRRGFQHGRAGRCRGCRAPDPMRQRSGAARDARHPEIRAHRRGARTSRARVRGDVGQRLGRLRPVPLDERGRSRRARWRGAAPALVTRTFTGEHGFERASRSAVHRLTEMPDA